MEVDRESNKNYGASPGGGHQINRENKGVVPTYQAQNKR